jgi:hypothetical protein
VLIPLLCFWLRKTEYNKVKTGLRVSSLGWSGLEIFKLVRFAYFGGVAELLRQLPLHLCSIFLFALPFAAWGKGKLKLAGESFLSSFGILGGLLGLTFTAMFNTYPIIQFNGLHSMLFHASMVFTGFWLLIGGHVKLHYKNFVYSLSLVVIIMVAAIIFNFSGTGSNYAYLRSSAGTPIAFLGALPPFLYVTVVLLGIVLGQALFYLPSFIIEKRKTRKQRSVYEQQ